MNQKSSSRISDKQFSLTKTQETENIIQDPFLKLFERKYTQQKTPVDSKSMNYKFSSQKFLKMLKPNTSTNKTHQTSSVHIQNNNGKVYIDIGQSGFQFSPTWLSPSPRTNITRKSPSTERINSNSELAKIKQRVALIIQNCKMRELKYRQKELTLMNRIMELEQQVQKLTQQLERK